MSSVRPRLPAPNFHMSKFSIVTVVYEKEISMLGVQARSITKFVTDVESIVIINNASTEELIPVVDRRLKKEVLPLYGNLIDKVKIYNVKELTSKVFKINGWESQQILKLLSGNICQNLIMILDPKNYFIKECNFGSITQNKKPNMVSKNIDEGLEEYFYNSCRLMKMSDDQIHSMLENNKGISPPFLVYSDTLKECKEYLERLFQKSIVDGFPVDPVEVFEFYLIGSYISINYGLDKYYNNTEVDCVYRIHRHEYKEMMENQIDQLAQDWENEGLFSYSAAKLQIEKIKKDIEQYNH